MSKNSLNIWIDITNSPHVLFFNPIIKELRSRGHNVLVTARDFAQTIGLLDYYHIDYVQYGKHGGKNILHKVINLLKRSFYFYNYIKKRQIDLAITHNSIDACLVSKVLHIPVIDIFDYEYAQFHHINFRCATKIMCPEYIDSNELYKYGATDKKIIKYHGLKEQMYLSDYEFDDDVLNKLNIDSDKVIVVLRPPADMALYHHGISNNIYLNVIKYCSIQKDTVVVFLGRTNQQKEFIRSQHLLNFIIPDKAIDGPSLINNADMVISGGGTMNREACALGVPVYTIFALKIGGVDQFLIKTKLMNKLTELKFMLMYKISFQKKLPFTNVKLFVDVILKEGVNNE